MRQEQLAVSSTLPRLNKLSICQKMLKHLEISSVMGVCEFTTCESTNIEYQQISESEMELSLLSLQNIGAWQT